MKLKKKGLCDLECLNGGSCVLNNNVPQCSCPCSFSGTQCQFCINFVSLFYLITFVLTFFYSLQKDNSPCNSNPCLNGGTCLLNSNACAYLCQCSLGFAGSNCALRKLRRYFFIYFIKTIFFFIFRLLVLFVFILVSIIIETELFKLFDTQFFSFILNSFSFFFYSTLKK